MNFTNRLESDLVLISQFHLAQNAGHLEIPLTEKDWFCQIENLEQIDLPSRHSKKKKSHSDVGSHHTSRKINCKA